jgi:hypothetical protein
MREAIKPRPVPPGDFAHVLSASAAYSACRACSMHGLPRLRVCRVADGLFQWPVASKRQASPAVATASRWRLTRYEASSSGSMATACRQPAAARWPFAFGFRAWPPPLDRDCTDSASLPQAVSNDLNSGKVEMKEDFTRFTPVDKPNRVASSSSIEATRRTRKAPAADRRCHCR